MAGRVNQKARTRQALIDAAQVVLESGRELTIPAAAQAAQVSTATAYRYFSEPHDLVLECAAAGIPVLDDLPDEPAARLDAVVRRLAGFQLDREALWRAVLAGAVERGIAAEAADAERATLLRRGARMEMTRRALAPLEHTLGPTLHRRLTMAIMLVYGMEALVVTRDACGLDPDEATEVMRWAAQGLLQAAMTQAANDPPPESHAGETRRVV